MTAGGGYPGDGAARAFVSSSGNDANAATNCAQTALCKTFAGAFPVSTAGGELIALDVNFVNGATLILF